MSDNNVPDPGTPGTPGTPGGEMPNQPTTPLPPQPPQPSPADAQPTTPLQPVPQQPVAPQQQPGQPFQQPTPGYVAAPPAPPAAPQPPAGYAPGPAPQAPMNALAIVAFIASFFVSLVGIICGHIALSQIKKTGERGRGFALAGTIIGYVALAATVLSVTFFFVFAGIAMQAANTSLTELEQLTEELEPVAPTTEPEATTPIPGDDASSGTGERSPEFCAALNDIATSDAGTSSEAVDPALVESFRKLAEADSPNQQVYEQFYNFIQNPLDGGDTETLMNDYFEAVMEDTMACL